MQVLNFTNGSFEDFLKRVQETRTKEEFEEFKKEIIKKEFSEIELSIEPLTGFTGVTIYKYFAKKFNDFLYFTEFYFTNYVDDYNISSIITQEEPQRENILKALKEYQELKEGYEI